MIHIRDLIIVKLIIPATNGARKEDIISDNCAVTANPSPLKSEAKGIIIPTSKITSRAETVETAMIRIFVFFRESAFTLYVDNGTCFLHPNQSNL